MKNIFFEKPTEILHGRLLTSVNFVSDEDLSGKKILDIGCGYGWCEINFLKRGVKKISAIEISENDLTTIRQNVKDERLELKEGSAIKLPFPDGSFDTIVSWEVIEHIHQNTESVMFKEVYRVLKPNGHFYLSTPHRSFFANILDPAWWLIGHRHYSVENLYKFAQKSNFRIVETKIFGSWWTLVSTLDLYIAKWLFRRSRFFNNFLSKKESEEYSASGFVNIFMKLKKV